MLDKTSNQTETIKLNNRTKFTVKNVRKQDDEGNITYQPEITLKHKPSSRIDPLAFNDSDEIQDYIMNIDLTDGQLALAGTERKDLQ